MTLKEFADTIRTEEYDDVTINVGITNISCNKQSDVLSETVTDTTDKFIENDIYDKDMLFLPIIKEVSSDQLRDIVYNQINGKLGLIKIIYFKFTPHVITVVLNDDDVNALGRVFIVNNIEYK